MRPAGLGAPRRSWWQLATIFAGLSLLADAALGQQVVGGMIVPNGEVVTGPVYRRDGTFVSSIATGVDANTYIFSTPPTLSFVSNAPAVVVRTAVPSQYVRFYTAGVNDAVGSFIAPSNAVRGLTSEQVRNVLALPWLPDSTTLVKVPAGTCVLYGQIAPILGNFPANPPSIPAPGPWGRGGALQGYLIGPSSDPNCQNATFVLAQDYVNQQSINGFALAYRPNAGVGNTYAVAAALDVGAFPAQFSDMDTIYNSLDLLNYGSPEALQMALKQLDGESYADYGYLRMAAPRLFLDVMHRQMQGVRNRKPTTASALSAEAPLSLTEPHQPPMDRISEIKHPFASTGVRRTESGGVWFAPYGSFGVLYGDARTHSTTYALQGFAAGGDLRFAEDFVVGSALSYSSTSFSTSIVNASGTNQAFSAAVYASFAPHPWYVEAALGYAYNWASMSRTIAFPGVLRRAQGNPIANQFLGSVESGVAVPLNPRLAVTPFGRLDVTSAAQNGFSESGAGAAGLNAAPQTTTGVRSIIGVQLAGTTAIGEALHLWVAARAGWAHDYADLSGTLTANFLGKPDTSFTVVGPTPDRNAARLGVSATLTMGAGQGFLNYDADLSQSYAAHAVTLGLKVAF